MNATKRSNNRSMTTRLKALRDGSQEVMVPNGFSPWRLGQRVWFQAVKGRIEITPKPHGPRGAGRSSRRVRRAFRSLLKDRAMNERLDLLPAEGLQFLKERQRKDADDVSAGRRTARSLWAIQKGDLAGYTFTPSSTSEFDQAGEGW